MQCETRRHKYICHIYMHLDSIRFHLVQGADAQLVWVYFSQIFNTSPKPRTHTKTKWYNSSNVCNLQLCIYIYGSLKAKPDDLIFQIFRTCRFCLRCSSCSILLTLPSVASCRNRCCPHKTVNKEEYDDLMIPWYPDRYKGQHAIIDHLSIAFQFLLLQHV